MKSKTIILSSNEENKGGRGILTIYSEDDLLKCRLRLYNVEKLNRYCKLGIYHNNEVFSANLLEKNGTYESSFVGDFDIDKDFYTAIVDTNLNNKVIIAGGTYAGHYFNDYSVFEETDQQTTNSDNSSENSTNSNNLFEDIEHTQPKSHIIEPIVSKEDLKNCSTCDKCEKCIYKEFFYSHKDNSSTPQSKSNEIDDLNTLDIENNDKLNKFHADCNSNQANKMAQPTQDYYNCNNANENLKEELSSNSKQNNVCHSERRATEPKNLNTLDVSAALNMTDELDNYKINADYNSNHDINSIKKGNFNLNINSKQPLNLSARVDSPSGLANALNEREQLEHPNNKNPFNPSARVDSPNNVTNRPSAELQTQLQAQSSFAPSSLPQTSCGVNPNIALNEREQLERPLEQSLLSQFSYIFENYPADEELIGLIENSKFVKINENTQQYSIGAIYEDEKIKLLCYAIKSNYNSPAPTELGEHYQWLPLDKEDPLTDGYYLVFQDAKDLKILEL